MVKIKNSDNTRYHGKCGEILSFIHHWPESKVVQSPENWFFSFLNN